MGGATNRSFISTHFLLSMYFLTAQTYKCVCLNNLSLRYVLVRDMRLITWIILDINGFSSMKGIPFIFRNIPQITSMPLHHYSVLGSIMS